MSRRALIQDAGPIVMANSVSMTIQQTIRALHRRDYSKRKIARDLGIHHNTVDKHLGTHGESEESEESKGTIPTADSGDGEEGNSGAGGPKCTTPTTGSGGLEAGSKCTTPTTGSAGSAGGAGSGCTSKCEPWRGVIEEKLEMGLKAENWWLLSLGSVC